MIGDDPPPELEAYPDILERLDHIADTYYNLFVDTPKVFEYRGFATAEEANEFSRMAHETCRMVDDAIGHIYRVVDDIRVTGSDSDADMPRRDTT